MNAAQELARRLAKMEREIRLLQQATRTGALDVSSVDAGTLDVVDDSGLPRVSLGLSADGSYSVLHQNGPAHDAPSTPIVVGIMSAITVGWDGLMSDGSLPLADFGHLEVHVSTTEGFTPSSATLQTTMVKAGNTLIPNLQPGAIYFVVLVPVNLSGVPGTPSQPGFAMAMDMPASISPTPPANPRVGDIWFDQSSGFKMLQYAGSNSLGDFETGTDGWTAGAGQSSMVQSAAWSETGGFSLLSTSDGTGGGLGLWTANGPQMPVSPGDALAVNGYGQSPDQPVSVGFGVNWLDSAGVGIGSAIFGPQASLAGSGDAQTVPQLVAVAPDGAANCYVFATASPVNIAGLTFAIDAVTYQRWTAAKFSNQALQAGSITAAQIAAGAIVAGMIATGALDFLEAVGLSITAGKVSGSQVTTTGLSGFMAVYGAAGQQQTAVISATGAGSWVAPAGVSSVIVEAWGAGGGGGGANTTGSGGGGGGGGGEYAKSTLAVTPGNSYSYGVGAGGAAGSAGGNGGTGGNTSFTGDAAVTVTAHGGAGGTQRAAIGGASGAGGSGSTATTHFAGGNGAAGSGKQTTSTIVVSGTGSWVAPAGVSSVKVECWGAGGGGGGSNNSNTAGTAGGGGEYAREDSLAVTPGQSYSYSVGSGGAHGTATANAGNGGDTVFTGNSVTVRAHGGKGGTSSHTTSVLAGGAGGSGSANATHYNGGAGGGCYQVSTTQYGGGGGGSAGTGSAGHAGSTPGGGGTTTGASAVAGGGPGGDGSAGTGSDGNGPSSGPGGGGGGSASGKTSDHAGGGGWQGQIKITYVSSSQGGGGGGSAGTSSAGRAGSLEAGAGAVSGGGPGGGLLAGGTWTASPSAPPGGGGGGFDSAGAAGAGMRGQIKLTYTPTGTPSVVASIAGAAQTDPVTGGTLPEGGQFDNLKVLTNLSFGTGATVSEPAWTSLSLAAQWAAVAGFATPAYRVLPNGNVELRGRAQFTANGTTGLGNPTTIATLTLPDGTTKHAYAVPVGGTGPVIAANTVPMLQVNQAGSGILQIADVTCAVTNGITVTADLDGIFRFAS